MTDHREASASRRYCAQPPQRPIVLPEGIAPSRERAIRLIKNKWVIGTILHFCFVGTLWPDDQKDVVRWAFGTWSDVGIGLRFVEVDDPTEAELRIGFDQSDGSWSYVGTDVLKYEDRGRTMNFGWDLTTDWGRATALHEIGHALGMPHEHQNPLAGIVWNEEAVYEAFAKAPNDWSRDQTFHNILRKIPRAEVEGSSWDPLSIMHYPFEPGLIASPQPYDVEGIGENVQPSSHDIAWLRRFYPPQTEASRIEPMQLRSLPADAGAQRDFLFEPAATREYVIRTLGLSDVKIVVFEEREGEPRHLVAEDDSGEEANAEIRVKMVQERRYFICARVHYVTGSAGTALVVF
jgi:hypothetical protein